MQVFENLSSFQQEHQYCVATIGKYDGIHLGHQSILARVIEKAQSLNLPSLVILSEPQPEEFFAGVKAPIRINQFHDKVAFLETLGIDIVYRMNFDYALSQLSAVSFIETILVNGLGIKALIIGDDFHFGKNRQGDFSLLQKKGEALGFTTASVDAHCLGAERISSTLVREELKQGNCELVKQLLGRYYSISGRVVKGRQLGRELGAPTANIALAGESIPLQGVFAVTVKFNHRVMHGVANIGYNPTIGEHLKASLEVFIFDFDEDIYDAFLSVSFIKKIRNEEKFSNLEELKNQIEVDVQKAKEIFSVFN